MSRTALLALALLGAGCAGNLDGLVVALAPSTPDNLNASPIIVKAPLASDVEYRYEWEVDAGQWAGTDPGSWGTVLGAWNTSPGETWTVTVTPYIGRRDFPAAEGPAAVASTLITDAGRDTDNDGDGVTENQGDCDDTTTQIFPGVDRDSDGFSGCPFAFDSAPRDCDDLDAFVNPGRPDDNDTTRPLEDDDCDGVTDEDALAPANWVITEVTTESEVAGGEWIEVLYLGTEPRQIGGLELHDNGDTFVPLPQAVVSPGFFVLCPNPTIATALGVPCENTTSFSAATVGWTFLYLDAPSRSDGRVTLQWVTPQDVPTELGVAVQLDGGLVASSEAAEEFANWCPAVDEYGDGELGTPGEGNADCPAD